MYLSPVIVLHEYPCGEGTSRDEKNHRDAEVRNDSLLFDLPRSGNLDLRGYEDEVVKGEKKSLVDEKSLNCAENSASLWFRWS